MDHDMYVVRLYERAYRDIDEIYTYLAMSLLSPDTGIKLVDTLESAILSLKEFPERGAVRKTGMYANGRYRQLFVKNFIIIYSVHPAMKEVHVITVRYSHQNF